MQCLFSMTATLYTPETEQKAPVATAAEDLPTETLSTKLEGADLLAKVKEIGDGNKSGLVRACGYTLTTKSGKERLCFREFYAALLRAKGVDVDAKPGQKGRRLAYATKVQFNGNLLVGKAYTALLDLKPGDKFTVAIHPKTKSISLTPAP
jgi:hypothetical protein